MPRYVEYGSGSLGEVMSETPKDNRRPKGVNILPLNTGSGDSFGRGTLWYPLAHIRDADMSLWDYDSARNLFKKIRKGSLMFVHGMIVRHINGTKKGEITARGENGGWLVQWEGDDWSSEFSEANLIPVGENA